MARKRDIDKTTKEIIAEYAAPLQLVNERKFGSTLSFANRLINPDTPYSKIKTVI
jgi:hypothetical protein